MRRVPAWTRLIAVQAAAITVVAWPVASIRPRLGVDASWNAALHMAARDGLRFGHDVVFTYGPLGFLAVPKLHYPVTAALSLVFVALLTWTLSATVLLLIRRSLRPLPAFAAALLIVKFVPLEAAELFPIVIVMWCLIAALGDGPPALTPWLPALLGVAAGAALLIKFSGGVVALVVVLLAGAARGSHALLRTAGAVIASVVAFWLATARSLWGIPRFFVESAEIAAGYSEALAIDAAPRNAGVDLVVVALLFAAVGTIAAFRTRGPRVVSVLLITTLLMALRFKHGFVRHDGGHMASVFVVCMLVPLVWWRSARPNRAIAATVLAAGLFLYGSALVHDHVRPVQVARLANPVRSTTKFVRQAFTVAVPGEAHERIRASCRVMTEAAAIGPTIRAGLAGRSLHVDPTETSLVWALDLPWRAPPVFQMYSVYTAHLDRANAEFLRSPRAPDRVLRPNDGGAVDRHWPAFESPEYIAALLCNYSRLSAGPNWQVLERIPNRCGPQRALSVPIEVADGVPVTVPRAGHSEIVSARVECAADAVVSAGQPSLAAAKVRDGAARRADAQPVRARNCDQRSRAASARRRSPRRERARLHRRHHPVSQPPRRVHDRVLRATVQVVKGQAGFGPASYTQRPRDPTRVSAPLSVWGSSARCAPVAWSKSRFGAKVDRRSTA